MLLRDTQAYAAVKPYIHNNSDISCIWIEFLGETMDEWYPCAPNDTVISAESVLCLAIPNPAVSGIREDTTINAIILAVEKELSSDSAEIAEQVYMLMHPAIASFYEFSSDCPSFIYVIGSNSL